MLWPCLYPRLPKLHWQLMWSEIAVETGEGGEKQREKQAYTVRNRVAIDNTRPTQLKHVALRKFRGNY
jgi:hypothetical protein